MPAITTDNQVGGLETPHLRCMLTTTMEKWIHPLQRRSTIATIIYGCYVEDRGNLPVYRTRVTCLRLHVVALAGSL
jgi:hypothetical protein